MAHIMLTQLSDLTTTRPIVHTDEALADVAYCRTFYRLARNSVRCIIEPDRFDTEVKEYMLVMEIKPTPKNFAIVADLVRCTERTMFLNAWS